MTLEALERLPDVGRHLIRRYGRRAPKPEPQTEDPLDGLIGTILSQQNLDKVTARMFAALKRAFPRWQDGLEAGPETITHVLEAAGGGLARTKAHYIHRTLVQLLETKGELSLEFLRDMNNLEIRTFLQSLPGVGMKTASCVLLFELRRAAMPVDTQIHRIAKRLGFVPADENAVQTEVWFDTHLPKRWKYRWEFHVNMIEHGRQTCRSQRPKCQECVISSLCPSALTM